MKMIKGWEVMFSGSCFSSSSGNSCVKIAFLLCLGLEGD